MTNITNITTILDLFLVVNSETGGAFGLVSLFMVFIILLFSLKGYGFDMSFMASSLITWILSTFMWGMGMISAQWVITFAGLTVVGFIFQVIRSPSM